MSHRIWNENQMLFKHSTCGFPHTVRSAESCTSMASSHETKNHIDMNWTMMKALNLDHLSNILVKFVSALKYK